VGGRGCDREEAQEPEQRMARCRSGDPRSTGVLPSPLADSLTHGLRPDRRKTRRPFHLRPITSPSA